jgi:SAM-dependent methyltransferase
VESRYYLGAMPTGDHDVFHRMRGDWDRRAVEDHKVHIAAGHAGSDEEFLASGEQDLTEIVLDGVTLGANAEALEIGCGVGRLLLPLSKRVAVAHGVDISPVMVRKSKEFCGSAPNVRTEITDGTLSHLPDTSLDFVFSFIVFQHIPERKPIRRYVEEAARVLRPGGVFRFQVDGRWWWKHGRRGPDTYEGVKFSPEQVHELLAGTSLSLADEWGGEGHYHWVAARKDGFGARACLTPRGWDMPLLAGLLSRLGSERPEADAEAVRGGTRTLRRHLEALEERFAGSSDERFVEGAYRMLLGRAPDEAGRAYHLAILARSLEDRLALLDTVATSRGFLDLVRPFVPEVPWFAACEVLERLGDKPRPADFFEGVDAVTRRLEGLPPRDAIVLGFRAVLGHDPDEAAIRHHRPLVEGHPEGRRLFARELLASRHDPAPPGVRESRSALLPGESALGEAALAVDVLAEGESVADDRDFVRLAYERILGRPADDGGGTFYAGKLACRELSRAALVREFLWSDERRGG